MTILFLDDSNRRHKEFRRNSAGNIVHFVFTAAAAIDRLATMDFDQVYLDYDLTEDPTEAALDDYESGQVVADWVAAHVDRFATTRFIIHSLNKEGAAGILATLRSVGLDAHAFPWAWQRSPIGKDFHENFQSHIERCRRPHGH